MIIKPLIVITFLISLLTANNLDYKKSVTLKWLEDKPRNLGKDYYIYKFLKQDSTTPTDAINALGMSYNVNKKLFFAYAKALKHDETLGVSQCMSAKPKELIKTYADCIVSSLSINEASKLNALELDEVILRVENSYPNYANLIKIINAPIPFTKIISKDINTIYKIYLNSSDFFLENRLNYKIPKRKLLKIKDDKRFNKLLQRIILNKKLNIAQKAFFEIDDKNLSSESSFYLAINLINHNRTKEALRYLDNSYVKAKNQIQKNKSIFWEYLITKNSNLLQDLIESKKINIYTLYSNYILNKDILNIETKVEYKGNNIDFIPINTAIDWINIVNDTSYLDDKKIKFYEKSLPNIIYLTYFYDKFYKSKNYFINPYKDILKNYNLKRRTILTAIAKNKSSFIKLAISRSFNLGVMQNSFKNISIESDLMFEPKESIASADAYLSLIEKEYKHPFLIALAYNSSIEYVNSLKNEKLFTEDNSFEPFISIEMIQKDDVREESKDIISNYITYHNLESNKRLNLEEFFKTLKF